MPEAVFALADANSFYCSCEKVFRPDLEGQPVLVVGNNDGNVIARSAETKALGVAMGAPLHEVMPLVRQHGIHVFSANFGLYGVLSQRMMRVLGMFAPELEEYSIDEAFLRLDAVPPAERIAYATEIRRTVWQYTGIPVSIGIGATKTLSKCATEFAKQRPTNVCALDDPAATDAMLRQLPVGDVWGIGPARAAWLARYAIRTAYDLKMADAGWIRQQLSVVAARTVYELRGVSCLPLAAVRAPKREICTSRAFGHLVRQAPELREAVAAFVSRAAEKLRRQHSVSAAVTVFIRTNPFRADDRQYANTCTVTVRATNDTAALIQAAHAGLARIWRPGFAYHKAGVVLANLTREDLMQGDLFAEAEVDPGRRQLLVTVDAINRKFGRDTVRWAATGLRRPWKMNQRHRSPNYLTRWQDLPQTDVTQMRLAGM